jgi:tetratricopeptide (TPR) repeat protein
MPLPLYSNRIGMTLLGLAVLSLAACGGAQSRKAKHMARGESYLAAANYEKARIEFQNALQIDPADVAARYENGLVSEKLGRPRDAARFYESVIDVKPDHLEARAKLARLHLLAGDPDKALELIEPVMAKNPDNVELLTIRAGARVRQKKLDEALVDAERAVRLKPTDVDAVAVLAGVYESSGAKDKARTLLEQTVKVIPQSVDLHLILVDCYARDNNKEAMEAQLLDPIAADRTVSPYTACAILCEHRAAGCRRAHPAAGDQGLALGRRIEAKPGRLRVGAPRSGSRGGGAQCHAQGGPEEHRARVRPGEVLRVDSASGKSRDRVSPVDRHRAAR